MKAQGLLLAQNGNTPSKTIRTELVEPPTPRKKNGESYEMHKLGELNNLFLIVLQETFHYNSLYWNNKHEYKITGGETGFDSKETKLPTYWNTPFSKICLGMKIGNQTNFIVIKKKANSLYSLIADGKYRATSLGRDTWKKLIGSQASLQYNCNKEGFNAVDGRSSWSKARIGIISDNKK